jgi:hypothetical protein
VRRFAARLACRLAVWAERRQWHQELKINSRAALGAMQSPFFYPDWAARWARQAAHAAFRLHPSIDGRVTEQAEAVRADLDRLRRG